MVTSPVDCSGFGLHPACHANISVLAGGSAALLGLVGFLGLRQYKARNEQKYAVMSADGDDGDGGDEVTVEGIGTAEEASALTRGKAQQQADSV